MPAVLHCIVTDIENHRLHEQLLVWREKANADPLIQKIRELRTTVEKLTHDRYWYSNQAWEDQNRIETTVLFAKKLPKSTTVQRFWRVRTLKYRFLQRKMRKMSAPDYPDFPADPPDPVHGLLLGTYHPHAPESG